ncbi:MIR motif-containing protein [Glomus cerebriforme]|uniref:MIR motif-containing protein n=1 Tax=Glomus cerebriforme TaxID=658196 RepID=A0A397T2G2_9GLOM|nr:MIR motif-containing protein [Glomus cerebriforme]
MELPKYSGTIHPKEWLKQVQAHCYLKEIENEQTVLKICKLMIDSTIIIPDEINSFNELIETLKSHSTFNIFKNSCNKKLQEMEYTSQQDIAKFLANFRSLCNNVEINDPKEIIFLLTASCSNYFIKNEFNKRVDGINSIDKIFEIFSDVVFEESKTIKYGSLIALKHVATGKYLSSCNTYYQTGSGCQVVSASEKLPKANDLWNVSCISHYNENESYQYNTVCYNDTIYLTHKTTNSVLYFSNHKSPTTGHAEVNCRSGNQNLKCNPTNNNGPYVNTKDVITLSYNGYTLRSHDFTFTINNKTFQEVVGYQGRISGNDEWQIEIIK